MVTLVVLLIPAAFSQSGDVSGALTFRAYIDWMDEIHIQGGQLWVEHRRGEKLQSASVDGVDWEMSWNGNVSSSFSLSQSIPNENGYYYSLIETSGRGEIEIVSFPNSINGYETAIQIDDASNNGADWYEFTLAWKTTLFEEPPLPDDLKLAINVILPTYGDGVLTLQGESALIQSIEDPDEVEIANITFLDPLPQQAVNLSLLKAPSWLNVIFIEQPRSSNQYTATIALDKEFSNSTRYYSLQFTWEEVEEEPTPTPWPTPQASLPTPTPYPVVPRTLWFVTYEAFPDLNDYPYAYDSYIQFGQFFQELGAENDAIWGTNVTITHKLLEQYQCVLFSHDQGKSLSREEVQALEQYVAGGGSVFVTADQYIDYLLTNSAKNANSIVEPFGIEFGTKFYSNYGEMTAVTTKHPITDDLDSVFIGGGSFLKTRDPSQKLIWNDLDQTALAAVEWGHGRVVALGDANAVQGAPTARETNPNSNNYVARPLTTNAGQDYEDNRILAKNIARWMLKKDLTPTPSPTPMPENYLIISVSSAESPISRGGEFELPVKEDHVNLTEVLKRYPIEVDVQATQPIPFYPSNLVVEVLKGDFEVVDVEVPSDSNHHNHVISMKGVPYNNGRFKLLLTWGNKLQPTSTPTPSLPVPVEPTWAPTPWPTWDASEPSPTPFAASKVLCIADSELTINFSTEPYLQFRRLFKQAGAQAELVYVSNLTVTDELLNQYNAVVFGFALIEDPLTIEEQQAVKRFVRSGGSIFVIGNQTSQYVLQKSTQYANSITEPFGIHFSTTTSDDAIDFTTHPVVSHVGAIEVNSGSKLQVYSPAKSVGQNTNGETVLAVAEDGYGRVIAFGDNWIFQNDLRLMRQDSLTQFAENIVHWMLRQDDEIPKPETWLKNWLLY
ncbi:hypothetical protein K8I31_15320 [bacterium]|nr:hypothetical protein [bacterium]